MIATILPSSTTFHAVEYNERKVAKGQAVLLEMKNFGYVGAADSYTPEQLQQYLIDYSARNEHIRKAQFHVAISCRGHEYSAYSSFCRMILRSMYPIAQIAG